MPRQPRRLLLLLLPLLLQLLSGGRWSAAAARVRKKAGSRGRSCADLPEELLEQMFGRLSVGVMSAFHHALQLQPRDKENMSCPNVTAASLGESKSPLPVNMLSVAPWAYRILYDPTRYPRSIPEAYCLCKGCLLGPHGQESDQYRSAPVYAPSVVLKRTGSCVAGRHSYTEVYVSVAVGCTCVPKLPDKPGDAHKSNQSLDRAEVKAAGRLRPTRRKV